MRQDDTGSMGANGRTGTALVLVLIAVACFGVYANSFTNGFVWDDVSSVLINPHVQDPAYFFQLFREDQHPFGRGTGNFYRPLLAASFLLDYALSRPADGQELSPLLFHLTNTLWHFLASAFFFVLLRRLRAPLAVAAAAALLYTVHPLHTEAVTYISGRGDPMSAALVLAGLVIAAGQHTGRRQAVALALSTMCFVAGLLSKESAVVYPVLLAMVLAVKPWPESPGHAGRLTRWAPLAAAVLVAVVYGALRATVLRFASGEASGSSAGLPGRLFEAAQALALYIRLVFVPTGLHMERTLAGTPAWVAAAGAGMFVLLVAWAAAALWRGKKLQALGIGWFLVCWLPISGVFPLNAPMAEHWMYLPLAGLLTAAADLAFPLFQRGRVQWAGGALVYAACVALAVLTIQRNNDWKDNETIFRSTLEHNPESIRVNFNLAVLYGDVIKNAAGARRHYKRVIALREAETGADATDRVVYEDEIESRVSLGYIELDTGNTPAAAEQFQAVMGVQPANQRQRELVGEANAGLGRCFLLAGDAARARTLFERAVEVCPELRGRIPELPPAS
jgi:protein O-mannosyl-transferase